MVLQYEAETQRRGLIDEIEAELAELQKDQKKSALLQEESKNILQLKEREILELNLQISDLKKLQTEGETTIVHLKLREGELNALVHAANAKVVATENEMRVILKEMERQKIAAKELAKLFDGDR